MKLRIVLLVLAASVILGVAASAEEAPAVAAPTPPPSLSAPAQAGAEAGPDIGARGQWGCGDALPCFGFTDMIGIGLALAILIVFLAGWKRGRFVRVPLFLGLFALGIGLMGMGIGLIDLCTTIACKSGAIDSVDFAEGLSRAMVSALIGLVAAICGGLLTWILHARDQRLDRLAAEAEGKTEEDEVSK